MNLSMHCGFPVEEERQQSAETEMSVYRLRGTVEQTEQMVRAGLSQAAEGAQAEGTVQAVHQK